jgi:2-polyprenyl-3-methyl-5-hydroxy-6-metoxy-1,4-benzoquinol methylase
MDYAAQKRFLDSYNLQWMIGAAAIIVLSSLALRDAGAAAVVFFGLLSLTALSAGYLGKYLHIHHEPDRRYRWAVRARWILVAAGVVIGSLFTFGDWRDFAVVVAAAVWIALVNALAAVIFRNSAMPVVYVLGDLWLLAMLALLGVDWFIVAGLTASLLTFSVLLNAGLGVWFPIVVIVAGVALLVLAYGPEVVGRDGALFVTAVGLNVCIGAWLARKVKAHAAVNYEATIAELEAFTGFARPEVEERLLTSQQALVNAWTKSPPNESDKAAMAAWYAANSLTYLFDLARFHLSYKHIAFSLDVLDLSRGQCLEYGAGKGELAIALAERGCEVTYFDVAGTSRNYAEWKAGRKGLRLRFTSARNEISPGPYDTIVSLDVLEHLPDLEGELSFLVTQLAAGGRLILTLPVGATESHPMHLAHRLDARDFLASRELRNGKTFRLKLFGSEILRKRECLIFEKRAPTREKDGP